MKHKVLKITLAQVAALISHCAALYPRAAPNYYNYFNDYLYQDNGDYIGAVDDIGDSSYNGAHQTAPSYDVPVIEGQSAITNEGCGFDSIGYFKDYQNCGTYYKCELNNGTWNRIVQKCPKSDQSYNETLQNCVNSPPCSAYPAAYPRNTDKIMPKICTQNYEKFQDPQNCSSYYVCHDTGTFYTLEHKHCNKVSLINKNKTFEYFFHEELQGCFPKSFFEGSECPQHWKIKPDDWKCAESGNYSQHPENCAKYYKCNRNGTHVSIKLCPSGYIFNTNASVPECILGECPKPGPPKCNATVTKFPHPYSCNEYNTKCFECKDSSGADILCYTNPEKCPDEQWFDDVTHECVTSAQCPQKLKPLPSGDGWNCTSENDTNVDPGNCKQYYNCIKCTKPGGWCIDFVKCGKDALFDDFKKKCIDTDSCPQKNKVLPSGPGWHCEQDGEKNVHPKNCSKLYKCRTCAKEGGWCYERRECLDGRYFDQNKRSCEYSPVCPQDLIKLPPHLECATNPSGNWNEIAENCTAYYECYPCQNGAAAGKECIVYRTCPSGQIFDQELKCKTGRCSNWPEILPDIWNCTNVGDEHVDPMDCSTFYKCVKCPDSDKNPWCYVSQKCDENSWFDDDAKKCVAGQHCPQDLKEIGDPPDWDCSKDGQLSVLPGNCSQFFECLSCPNKPRGWCYFGVRNCPAGYNFDQLKGECCLGTCPQTRPELPDGWTCQKDKEKQVVPANCSMYYSCHKCAKPKGWCYDQHPCPVNQTFDNASKMCMWGRCPQLDPQIPDDWKCNEDGEINVVPDDCTMYYTCISCEDDNWCYKGMQMCSPGQTFNDTGKKCVDGRCPQYPPILPDGWKCAMEGEIRGHPEDCSSYYTCSVCPDVAEYPQGRWCFTLGKCGAGQVFDPKNRACVKGTGCKLWPPLLPPGWNCSAHEEQHVLPTDCTKYYTCISFQKEWKYIEDSCAEGYYFDDVRKICVMNDQCPQHPKRLPEGWICDEDGDKHQHPDDCSKYFTCVKVENSTLLNGGKSQLRKRQDDGGYIALVKVELIEAGDRNSTGEGESTTGKRDTTTGQSTAMDHPGDGYYMTLVRVEQLNAGGSNSTSEGESTTGRSESTMGQSKSSTGQGASMDHPGDGHYFKVVKIEELYAGESNTTDQKNATVQEESTTATPETPTNSNVSSYYWSYIITPCEAGENFNEAAGSCQAGPCMQNLPPLPPGWICVNDGELMVHPQDCTYYFKCIKNQTTWTYELKKCAQGYNFDQRNKYCKAGSCPQKHPSLPEGWKCEGDGVKEVYPGDCSKYYTCVACLGGTITGAEGSAGKSFGRRLNIAIGRRGGAIRNGIGGARNSFGSFQDSTTGTGTTGTIGLGSGCVEGAGWCYKDVQKCKPGFKFNNKIKLCVPMKTEGCPEDVPCEEP